MSERVRHTGEGVARRRFGAAHTSTETAAHDQAHYHAAVRLRTLLTPRLTSASSHLSACLSTPSSPRA